MSITVGELKELLEGFTDDTELYFSGLDFYRGKRRGEKVVQIEFNQQVYKDSSGKVVIEDV